MTIYSAQSGDWSSTSTWVGGVVPDLSNDDVVIAAGHTVAIQSGDSLTLGSGRWLSVEGSATLDVYGYVQLDYGSSAIIDGGVYVESGYSLYAYGDFSVNSGGWLDCYGSVYFDGGNSPTIDGSLYVGYNGNLCISNSTSVAVNGSLYVDSNGYLYLNWYANLYLYGSATIWGYAYAEWYSYLYVYSQLTVESGGSLYVSYSGYMQAESGAMITLIGWLDSYDGASVYVTYGAGVLIKREGGMGVGYYANLTVDGAIDAFGYFNLSYDAYLNVNSGGRMRVYHAIQMSGQLFGGGRIDLMRREARIDDYNGNSLIHCDQAYGFGQTLVA